jgi:hypothetical protein
MQTEIIDRPTSLAHLRELAVAGFGDLAAGRWRTLSDYSGRALDRALELLGLTIADPKNRLRLKEITRVREALLDYFLGSNEYASSAASWHSYFHAYGMAVALQRQVQSVS